MELARRMVYAEQASDTNPWVPAGYTYLGQFIDHDLTFDPTSRLDRDNDADALIDFRTPRFDLDSLYGAGPIDQPYLYDWDEPRRGVRSCWSDATAEHEVAAVDLPRNAAGRVR